MKKLFQVQINKNLYWVFDIPGKEHLSENGEPNTWWVYFHYLNDNEIPYSGSEMFVPYHISINRLNWDISIK